MDESEQLARSYLDSLGFNKIVYEPDGNIPPDFLADDQIAIEVRRLNENEVSESGTRALEETAIPLQMRIRKLLISFGPSKSGVSWFVCCRFRRPLPRWDRLRCSLHQALELFIHEGCSKQLTSVIIGKHFELKLIRASDPHATIFVFGGYSDGDSGGFVVDLIQRNLRICIEEKTRKIAPVRHKYPKWWLLLIDRISYGGLDQCDVDMVQRYINPEHGWDKIILVNPLDCGVAFEIT